MAETYTRQSSFTNGDIIEAPLFNAEFDQLEQAFHETDGHTHDGTPGGGAAVPFIAEGNNKVYFDNTNPLDPNVLFKLGASLVKALDASDFSSSAQATAGTDNQTVMTPLRVYDALKSLGVGGSTTAITTRADLESLNKTVFFRVANSDSINVGLPTGNAYVGIHLQYASGPFYGVQVILTASGNPQRVYIRWNNNGTWQPFTEIWHSGNLVKQTDRADTTAGRVLTVGAFGLGNTNTLQIGGVDVTDADLVTVPGMWASPAAPMANCPPGFGGRAIYMFAGSSQYGVQIAFDPNDTASSQMAIRQIRGGTWRPWSVVWHQDQLPLTTLTLGITDLNLLTGFGNYLTETSGMTNLPAGWPQGRYIVEVIGRITDSYCTQVITDVGNNGTGLASTVAKQAIRRMRNAGTWSDWYEILNTNSASYKELPANVSNIADLRARAGTFDNQRIFVAEYNAGTDVGGGSFIWNATSTTADNGVTVFAVTGTPTGRWIREWSVLTPEMAGCVGDNTTENITAINRLISFALVDNTPIHWERRRYLVNSSIANFHSCTHVGTATLSRQGVLWHITPQGSQVNTIYVSHVGNASNDGLSSFAPTTISRARDILKNVGSKADDGIWRVSFMAGTYTDTGIRFTDFPVFRNKLEFVGPTVNPNDTPQVTWNGSSSSEPIALRADSGVIPSMNMLIKDIKFVNWTTGAISMWAEGAIVVNNVHCDTMEVAVSVRKAHARVIFGRYENITTEAITVAYGANGNVGGLNGEGVYIRCAGAGRGIGIGRNTVAYIQGNDIDSTSCHINITRTSRVRTQANVFGPNYTTACVINELNSVWTPDNNEGYPDIYPTLTAEKPAYIQRGGAVHLKIDRLCQRSLHVVSDGEIGVTYGPGVDILLNTLNPTFVPFRLPKWFLYSPTFRLDLEIGVVLAPGAGGTLTLTGNSSTSTLASITIPNVSVSTRGIIKFTVRARGTRNTAHYDAYFEAAGVRSEMQNTSSLNTAALRTNAEDDLLYRLYWTHSSGEEVQFFNMRTYVEA